MLLPGFLLLPLAADPQVLIEFIDAGEEMLIQFIRMFSRALAFTIVTVFLADPGTVLVVRAYIVLVKVVAGGHELHAPLALPALEDVYVTMQEIPPDIVVVATAVGLVYFQRDVAAALGTAA